MESSFFSRSSFISPSLFQLDGSDPNFIPILFFFFSLFGSFFLLFCPPLTFPLPSFFFSFSYSFPIPFLLLVSIFLPPFCCFSFSLSSLSSFLPPPCPIVYSIHAACKQLHTNCIHFFICLYPLQKSGTRAAYIMYAICFCAALILHTCEPHSAYVQNVHRKQNIGHMRKTCAGGIHMQYVCSLRTFLKICAKHAQLRT